MLSLMKFCYQLQGSWLAHRRPRAGLGSAVETGPQPCASVRKRLRPWQYWLWSFRFGDAKLGRFLLKIEQILRKFGYF